MKDAIFIVLAVWLIRYLYRKEMLGETALRLGFLLAVLAVWLGAIVVTWKLMAYTGIPLPVAVAVEILGGAYLQFMVLAAVFYYKNIVD